MWGFREVTLKHKSCPAPCSWVARAARYSLPLRQSSTSWMAPIRDADPRSPVCSKSLDAIRLRARRMVASGWVSMAGHVPQRVEGAAEVVLRMRPPGPPYTLGRSGRRSRSRLRGRRAAGAGSLPSRHTRRKRLRTQAGWWSSWCVWWWSSYMTIHHCGWRPKQGNGEQMSTEKSPVSGRAGCD